MQLLDHISKFECLSECQSACRVSHYVETDLCRLNNDLINSRINRDTILLIQLDLSAAIDTVDIKILLKDLKNIGLDGKVFVSYLNQRSFKVSSDV